MYSLAGCHSLVLPQAQTSFRFRRSTAPMFVRNMKWPSSHRSADLQGLPHVLHKGVVGVGSQSGPFMKPPTPSSGTARPPTQWYATSLHCCRTITNGEASHGSSGGKGVFEQDLDGTQQFSFRQKVAPDVEWSQAESCPSASPVITRETIKHTTNYTSLQNQAL